MSWTVYRTGRLPTGKAAGVVLGLPLVEDVRILYFLPTGIISLDRVGIWSVVRTVPEVVACARDSV